MSLIAAIGLQPTEVLEAGEKAADTLTQTVLGSLVVLFFLSTGAALWLAWKAKQGELNTVKEILEANAEEKVAAKDLALEQTKAYQDLAKVVESHSTELGRLKEELAKAMKDGGSLSAQEIRGLGRRIDALAGALPNLDTTKYYSGRE